MKKAIAGSLFVAAVLAGACILIAGRTAMISPVFDLGRAEVRLDNGEAISFSVELARTPEEQAYGLMFRNSLAKDQGMCFLFDPPQPVSFWMKDTLIPLDMLFVRPGGEIVKIAAEAKPMDETPIASSEPIEAVLEINGGLAAQRGIRKGNRLTCVAGYKL